MAVSLENRFLKLQSSIAGFYKKEKYEQMDLFTDYMEEEKEKERLKERKIQEAMLAIKKKYGKNAILKGMNLEEGATAMERNRQIGGHKSGE